MDKRLILITGPQRNTLPGYWLYDYLIKDGYKVIPFFIRKNDLELLSSCSHCFRIFKIIIFILNDVQKEDLILVYDNDTVGIYIGLVISLFRPHLVVRKINCMASNSRFPYSRLKKPFVKRAYTKIYTTVNNQVIAKLFSDFLGVGEEHFIPVPDSLSDFEADIAKIDDRQEHGYIFMGGATHRDYNLFLKVACRLPQYKFSVVTFPIYSAILDKAPFNVKVLYSLPEKDFYEVLAHSNIVFIPLVNDLQGGQMVLFQGALLEKPIVTTNNIAIHTYFSENSVKLVPIGGEDEAVEVLSELMENASQRNLRGRAAYEAIVKFTPDNTYELYRQKLFCPIFR